MAYPKMPTQVERLAALETQQSLMAVQMNQIDTKLDDLLALRHKGVGAFWLASSLLGTGMIGTIAAITGYLHHT